jgi:hypothetical protein
VPFTGSHPAAVLPFLRSPLPASALVIGSMAPDFPYYLPWSTSWPTHTPLGVVTVDLVLAAAGWAVWHGVLAAPALEHAPAPLRDRLTGRVRTGLRPRLTSVRSLALVVAGLLLGTATHVLWDEFTHPGRWATEHIAVLAATEHGRPGYSWAQDLSSLVGALVLVGWAARWWRRTPAAPGAVRRPASLWPWAVVAAAGLGGAATAVGQPDLRSAAVAAAFSGGAAAAVAGVLLAVAWQARRAADPGRRALDPAR